MRLFQCEQTPVEAITDPTAVHTPLGIVRAAASLNGASIHGMLTQASYLAGGGRIALWQHADIDLELLVCRPLFSPPLDLPVKECWGMLWRGRARAAIASLTLSAVWEEGYHWHEGGPDGGQYLYAKTWTDGKTEVTIGTQDDEMLAMRSKKGDYLPSQWESYFVEPKHSASYRGNSKFFENPVHYQLLSTGIGCPLPFIKAEQAFQIVFAVAWADADSPSTAVTSIAVEASPTQILAGGGCS